MSILEYIGPRSVCKCGHLGDGPDSLHGGSIGHRACIAAGCDCKVFTWMCFTKEFESFLRHNGVNNESIK